MKNRLAIVLTSLCAIIANSASAQNYSLTLDTTFGTKYVFRGVQLGDNTLHPSIELAKDDFFIGIWGALPTENRGFPENWGDEYDLYAGYGWALNDSTILEVGATLYYYPTASNTLEGYVSLIGEFEGVTTKVTAFHDIDLDATTLEGSGAYSFPLADGQSLDLAAYVGWVDLDAGGSYTYYGADLVYPIELSENATVSFGLHYADNNVGGLIPDSHLYGSASMTIGF